MAKKPITEIIPALALDIGILGLGAGAIPTCCLGDSAGLD